LNGKETAPAGYTSRRIKIKESGIKDCILKAAEGYEGEDIPDDTAGCGNLLET
jgi:hypothetical protein